MAKKITVTAMYQEVAIQLATSGRSITGRRDGVADIEQEHEQQQRHEHQPQPHAGGEEQQVASSVAIS
jgi:ABC-type ATPase involved in cell division